MSPMTQKPMPTNFVPNRALCDAIEEWKSENPSQQQEELRLDATLPAVPHEFAKMPPSFFCPITQSVMENPVLASDGNSYEREALEDRLRNHNRTARDNGPTITNFVPNRALRDAIEEWKVAPPLLRPSGAPAVAWSAVHSAQIRTFRAVALRLNVEELTDAQTQEVREVFHNVRIPMEASEAATASASTTTIRPGTWNPGIDAVQELRLAVERCKWFVNGAFRMKVYGEFAQYLRPQALFHELGPLDDQVKQDAARCYTVSLTKDNLDNPLARINEAIDLFSTIYPRNPEDRRAAAEEVRIRRERAIRWQASAPSRQAPAPTRAPAPPVARPVVVEDFDGSAFGAFGAFGLEGMWR